MSQFASMYKSDVRELIKATTELLSSMLILVSSFYSVELVTRRRLNFYVIFPTTEPFVRRLICFNANYKDFLNM